MTEKRKQIPWQEVEKEYAAGVEVAVLCQKYDIKPNTMYSRIRRNNWKRSLVNQVKERTSEIMAVVSESTSIDQAQDLDEKAAHIAVEAKAVSNVVVVQNHKKAISRFRDLTEQYAQILTDQMAKGTITVDSNGNAVELDIPADYVGKCLVAGTKALQTVIQLERQAHGLDNEKPTDEGTAVINIFDNE